MSAFIVGKPHIDALMAAGLASERGRFSYYFNGERHELNLTTCHRIGHMLWAENVKSVRARYPNVSADLADAPGPIGLTAFEIKGYRFPIGTRKRPAVEILKALSCYEYQSCEHDGWETSEAKAFCDALRHNMIAALPGYEEAEWEVA